MIKSNYVYHVGTSDITITEYEDGTFTVAVDGINVYGMVPKLQPEIIPVGELHPDITFTPNAPQG